MKTLSHILLAILISVDGRAASNCTFGVPTFNCVADPCSVAPRCSAYPKALCKANYCGGCFAEYYEQGKKVDCGTTNGLKLNGTGYLIYSSNIPANATSLLVTGTFSTRNNISHQVLVATENNDGNIQALFAVSKLGCFMNAFKDVGPITTYCSGSTKVNDGLSYDFTITLNMKNVTDGNGTKVEHITKTVISRGRTPISFSAISKFQTKLWNFEKAKIYLGGYKQKIYNTSEWEGCLSDVKIPDRLLGEKTNVIATYFAQSSNHTNPTVSGGPLPEKASVCDDISGSTSAPTTKMMSTSIPSNAAVLFPVLNIVLIFYILACISFN